MSGKRIEIVEPCVHGWEKEHWLNVDGSPIGAWQQGLDKTPCDGATRRVLTLDDIKEALTTEIFAGWLRGLTSGQGFFSDAQLTDFARSFLDALSDHTEGTP